MPERRGQGPTFARQRRDLLAVAAHVADPDGGGDLARVAHEPGVLVVLGGPRLARHVPARELRRGTGTAGDHAPQGGGDGVGHLGRDDLLGRVVGLEDDVAPGVLDPLDHHGLAVQPVVPEGGVGAGHVQHGDLAGPEHDGGDHGQLGLDAEGVGHLDDVLGAELEHELGEHHVGRGLGGAEQRVATSRPTTAHVPVVRAGDVEGHTRRRRQTGLR